MNSPENCDIVKLNDKEKESELCQIVSNAGRKESKMDSPQPNVVEEMCESYFVSLKTDLFLSSLYLAVTSNVVLLSVLLAFAKVILRTIT